MKKSSSILVKNNIDKNSIDSIAIGGFDGMHIAHQELFKNLNSNGAIISIETGYANLTPKKNRQEYTKYPIFYYDLEDIKALDGVEFIKMLQDDFKNLKKIVVGFDFGFGKNRAYKADDLNSLFDGEVVVVPEIKLNNSSVHSRVIREFIKEAKIKEANDFLGKEYKICGTVIKGQGLGKDEFVPTINIEVKDFLLPKSGVYVTKTIVDKIEYNSITFLGHRVTTDNSFAVETHILDKNIDVKNENIEIKFIDFIRDNQKFNSFLDLKNAILNDILIARNYFINF